MKAHHMAAYSSPCGVFCGKAGVVVKLRLPENNMGHSFGKGPRILLTSFVTVSDQRIGQARRCRGLRRITDDLAAYR